MDRGHPDVPDFRGQQPAQVLYYNSSPPVPAHPHSAKESFSTVQPPRFIGHISTAKGPHRGMLCVQWILKWMPYKSISGTCQSVVCANKLRSYIIVGDGATAKVLCFTAIVPSAILRRQKHAHRDQGRKGLLNHPGQWFSTFFSCADP